MITDRNSKISFKTVPPRFSPERWSIHDRLYTQETQNAVEVCLNKKWNMYKTIEVGIQKTTK